MDAHFICDPIGFRYSEYNKRTRAIRNAMKKQITLFFITFGLVNGNL